MSKLSNRDLSSVIISRTALIAFGVIDAQVPAISMPVAGDSEYLVESILYGGLYPAAMMLESWAYAALTESIRSNNTDSEFAYFKSFGILAESLFYKAQQLAAEATIELYGLVSLVPNDFGRLAEQTMIPGFPAAPANSSSKDAARGQMFAFYFRSLKPSIYKEDIEKGKITSGFSNFGKHLAPRGVMRLQPILTQVSESYNPNWERQSIFGNVQQVHRYTRTDRTINLGFSMYAESYQQLVFNLWRLNWLANHCYGKLRNFDEFKQSSGDTDKSRFVHNIEYKEFPFMKITVGTVFVELPCYITNMGVTYDMNAPWELGDEFENRITKWKNVQFPFKIDISLGLNVLYDTVDPTERNFYRQHFNTPLGGYLKWTESAGSTNPDDDESLLGGIFNVTA